MRLLVFGLCLGTISSRAVAQTPPKPLSEKQSAQATAPSSQTSAPKSPNEPDSVTIRIAGTELRAAVQIMQQYLDRPVIFTGPPGGTPVTFETPRPVAREDVPRLLRGLLESQGYELVADSASGTYRARLKEQPKPAQPVQPQSPFGALATGPARPAGGTPELSVIALKHARASDVASTINSLFPRGAASVAQQGSSRLPGFTDDVRLGQAGQQEQPVTNGARSASLTGELTIVPEPKTNSLITRANRQDFELVQSIIKQIDVRPAQALIEVLIVEARRDRSFSLGLGANMKDQYVGRYDRTAVGGEFTPGKGGLGDFTLRIMGVGGIEVDATISAAVGRGDVNVISRPVVLTSNDEQAEVS